MKKTIRTSLLVLFAVALLAAFALTASAAEEVASGTCGSNLTWVLTDDGTLTISGRGNMYNYTYYSDVPWYSRRDSIKEVILPDGITAISNYAFYSCKNLSTVIFPETLTSIGEYAFRYCYSLTEITIPKGVTTIGDYAFDSCTNLTIVTFPYNLTAIGDCAFYGCSLQLAYYSRTKADWEKISIGKGNDRINNVLHTPEENVSGTCGENLTWTYVYTGTLTISGFGAMYDYDDGDADQCAPWHGCRDSIREIILSDGITTIGNDAFYYCRRPTEITLPESVTTIGDYAFLHCEGLTTVTLSEKLISIGDRAFYWCYNLSSIILPEGLTSIGKYAFSDCYSLASITLPESLTTIGSYAFSSCVGLTEVIFPEGLTSIGSCAFSDCSGLTEVIFPESLTTIGSDAFRRCSNLNSITFPASLTTIAGSAFSDCSKLNSVTIPVSVERINSYAFSGCSGLLDVYYGGTKFDWTKISIGGGNDPLLNATLHTQDYYELLSLTLKDTNNTLLNAIPASTFYANAKVKKLHDADPVLLLLVTYDKNGRMLNVIPFHVDISTGESSTFTTQISNPDGKVGEVKAFLLSSLGNPTPLTEALSVK